MNKQVHSFQLTLFPMGSALRNHLYLRLSYKNTQFFLENWHSDDDHNNQKRLVYKVLTAFYLKFLKI